MKIVCTKAELVAMTRECQSIRSNFSEDYGCEGCVFCHLCNNGENPAIPFASSSFEVVCDIEVVLDG